MNNSTQESIAARTLHALRFASAVAPRCVRNRGPVLSRSIFAWLLVAILSPALLFPVAGVADESRKKQVYLVGGGPLSSELEPTDFVALKQRVESDPALASTYDVHVYYADGRSIAGTGALRDDVRAAASADKLFVFYSLGNAVLQNEIIPLSKSEHIQLGTVVTLGASRGLEPINVNFVDTLVNLVINYHSQSAIPVEGRNTVDPKTTQSVGPLTAAVKHPQLPRAVKADLYDLLRLQQLGVISSGGAGGESRPLENVTSESFRILSERRYWNRLGGRR
jgi:hypothetical protein